jgi:hypothetical protein
VLITLSILKLSKFIDTISYFGLLIAAEEFIGLETTAKTNGLLFKVAVQIS